MLQYALNAKAKIFFIVIGNHRAEGMKILNTGVTIVSINGGLMGQTHNNSLEQTLGSAAQFERYVY